MYFKIGLDYRRSGKHQNGSICIHTYIHTLLLPPQWGFSGTITQITKLLITKQSKLIKCIYVIQVDGDKIA